ncbi:MAG: sulfotransferase domain-containing protein [Flavobacteriales bacterium]
MPVKYIINGYFRSGTTMLYDAVRKAVGEDGFSFYEPCYPKLGLVIRDEQSHKAINPLHGKKVWHEYLRLDENELKDILRNHPNTRGEGIANDRDFMAYINQYNALPNAVFLQTNRYHFFLDIFFKEYNAQVVHVVRNPIHVFESIYNSYFQSVSPLKKIVRKLTQRYTMKNYFGVQNEFNWILQHTGFPFVMYNNWRLRYFKKPDYFSQFVVVWIVSNYYALKSIHNHAGRLVIYERLLVQPDKEFKDLSEYLGLEVEAPEIKLGKHLVSGAMISKFKGVVKDFGLQQQWGFISQELDKHGINYLQSMEL